MDIECDPDAEDAEDADAACDSALEWACELQQGDSQLSYRQNALSAAAADRMQWRRFLKRRDWHLAPFPDWVSDLNQIAEEGYDAGLVQKNKKSMEEADEEIHNQRQEMIRHDSGTPAVVALLSTTGASSSSLAVAGTTTPLVASPTSKNRRQQKRKLSTTDPSSPSLAVAGTRPPLLALPSSSSLAVAMAGTTLRDSSEELQWWHECQMGSSASPAVVCTPSVVSCPVITSHSRGCWSAGSPMESALELQWESFVSRLLFIAFGIRNRSRQPLADEVALRKLMDWLEPESDDD